DLPGPAPAACVGESHGALRVVATGEQPERDGGGLGEQERRIRLRQRDDAASLEAWAGNASPTLYRVDPRLDERGLALVPRPRRVALPKERCGPGDVRRRHARPGERGPAATRDGGQDIDARRGDVRLETERDRRRADGRELRMCARRRAAPDL